MSATTYDVAIIGAGVTGCAIARKLSAYDLKTVLLEKEVDVGFGVSKANSGIIHAGFHHELSTLKARLEIQGNLMFDSLRHQLKFPFRRLGVLVVAFNDEEMKTAERLYDRGVRNGVPGLELCGADRILALEPKLSDDARGGLYAPSGGVIEPYRFVFALAESAIINGVDLKLGFQVDKAARLGDVFEIVAADGRTLRARRVVNAAGLYADAVSAIFAAEKFQIKPRKGEEYLLDRSCAGRPNHVIFPVPGAKTKGTLVIPTVEGTTMVGPTAELIADKEDRNTTADNLAMVFDRATRMVPSISNRDIITAFTGSRPTIEGDDFYIDMSRVTPGLVQVAGIQSPGLTASPAIAEYVKELLKRDGMTFTEKVAFTAELPEPAFFRTDDPAELDRQIGLDPARGNIICRCESVSEAEIVEAIRKGHATLDGVKFSVRAGMGRCQGGFCSHKILKIIARETGLPIEKITKRGPGSEIVLGELTDAMIAERVGKGETTR